MIDSKKAQGMSLKVVIVAVILLIVMVVLVLIFSGKLKLFGQGTSSTSAQFTGTKCVIPGTNNECGLSEDECERQGGVFDDTTQYENCFNCCLK